MYGVNIKRTRKVELVELISIEKEVTFNFPIPSKGVGRGYRYTVAFKADVLYNYKVNKQFRQGQEFLRELAMELNISSNTMNALVGQWRSEFRCLVSN